MNIRKWIAENTGLISALMIAVGVILILIAKNLPVGVLRNLVESFDVLFVTIFFTSFLYEKFLAEKHFSQFREVIGRQLKEMDNVQSACSRLGIREVFENRNEYERQYPLLKLFQNVKPKGRVLVVARSLFHLFNKTDAIKAVLEQGATLEVACVAPDAIDRALPPTFSLKASDVRGAVEQIREVAQWIVASKPSGSLEFRTHDYPLPDSFFFLELKERKVIAWDLSFGRDLTDKSVFILEPNEVNLGVNLLNRYSTIWDSGKPCLKIVDGKAETDDLASLIERYK